MSNIKDLRFDDKNFNKHTEYGMSLLEKSLRENGAGRSILIDKDNNIIAGNGIIEAAGQAGFEKVKIVETTGDEIIAVKRTDLKLDSKKGREMALADNATASIDLDWNDELISEEADKWGFDTSDWGMNFDFDKDTEVEEDEAPEANENEPAKSILGEVYHLGNHRLMCGDSTDAGSVAILMDGQKADMVFTDPPYGMKKEAEGVLNDNLNFDDLLDFNSQWITLTFGALKDNGSWYCWGIDEPLMDIYSNILKPMARENKIIFRNLITWDKGNGQGQLSEDFRMYPIADEKCLFVMCGTQNYYDEYLEIWEPIRKYMIGEKTKAGLKTCKEINKIIGSSQKGGGMATHYFGEKVGQFSLPTEEMYSKLQKYCTDNGIKAFEKEYEEIKKEYEEIKKGYYSTRAYFDNTHDNMNNVWHFDRAGKDEREHTGSHATPKPIALCSRAIKSSSREGETVLDVFGGSGSTLIACEQLGRKCYMMELDPKYCDVIRKRYWKFAHDGEEEGWEEGTKAL